MKPSERAALLDVIRAFKNPDDSDLDAALNVIASHADVIRRQQNVIRFLTHNLKTIGETATLAAERGEEVI